MLLILLSTTSVLPSAVTAMPCDGSAPAVIRFLSPGAASRRSPDFNALYFLVRRKIDYRKSIKIGHLNEYVLRGSVGIGRHRHRTDAFVHLNRPGQLVGLRVNHIYGLGLDGAGNHVFAVRR